MDILWNKEKYNKIDEKKIEEDLERELEQMSYNEQEDPLNQTQDSMYFQNYKREVMIKWEIEKESLEKHRQDALNDYNVIVQERHKMIEDMEGEIYKLKEMTNQVFTQEQNNNYNNCIDQYEAEEDSQVFYDQKKQMDNSLQEQNDKNIKNDFLNKKKMQEIREKVKQDFNDSKQKNQYVFAEEKVIEDFINEKENQLDLQQSINSEGFEDDDDLQEQLSKLEELREHPNKNYSVNSSQQHSELQNDQKITLLGQAQQQKQSQQQSQYQQLQQQTYMRPTQSQINKSQLKSHQKNQLSLQSQEIEKRKEKMMTDREIMLMEREDLFSMEYEEYVQRKLLAEKDYRLPNDFPQLEENYPPPSNLKFPKVPTFSITPFTMLAIKEENLAPRNSLEICITDLKMVKNIYKNKKKPDLIAISSKNNNNAKSITTLLPINPLKQDNNYKQGCFQYKIIIPQPVDELKLKSSKQQNQQNYQQQLLLQQYNSKQDIYFQKVDNLQKEKLNELKEQIQKIGVALAQYQPKLLHTYLEEKEFEALDEIQEEVINNIQQQQKSINQIIDADFLNDLKVSTKLQLKLENIGDLKGIERLPNLKTLILSMNKLQDLTPLKTCKNILEINLGQNNISDYSAIGYLEELRVLNLELNKIEQMCALRSCRNLEVLNLSNNRIKVIDQLNECFSLKKLILFKNKIEKVQGLDKLIFLQELDLGNNKISTIENLEKNQLLRKLVLYNNQINSIPPNFSFFFLMELYLNSNQIKDISGFTFLPCLEYLNLRNNKVEQSISDDQVLVMPNLKTVLLGYNRMKSFLQVWNLIRYSPKLHFLEYNENDFLKQIPNIVQELYEYLLLKKMQNLEKVNAIQQDIGHMKYLSVRFDNFLVQGETSSRVTIKAMRQFNNNYYYNNQNSININGNYNNNSYNNSYNQNVGINKEGFYQNFNNCSQFGKFISLYHYIAREYQFMTQMESQIIKENKKVNELIPFTQTIPYFLFKNKSEGQHLISISQQYQQIFEIKCHLLNIFHQKQLYDHKMSRAFYKLRRFFCKAVYLRKKRFTYFKKNEKTIIHIQAFLKGVLIRLRTNMKDYLDRFRFRSKGKYALKIQKIWRGHKLRKKMKKAMGKIHYEDPDLDMDEDIDDWYNKEPEFDTGLKLPDNFDINLFLQPLQASKMNRIQNDNNNHHQKQQSQQQNTSDKFLPPLKNKKQENFHERVESVGDQSDLMFQQQQKDQFSISNNSFKNSTISNYSNPSSTTNKHLNQQQQQQQQQQFPSQQQKQQQQQQKQQQQQQHNQGPAYKVSQEEKEKIKTDWGWSSNDVAEAFAFRLEKERKRKLKLQSKQLTATERYEKFKKDYNPNNNKKL